MPDGLQIASNPAIPLAMIHGYGLAAQMALAAACKKSKPIHTSQDPKECFSCVSDNFDCVKSKFNYPRTEPFSGERIEIDMMPVMESYAPAHVRLQNYLFYLLGRACTKQTDIQRYWLIPGEKIYNYGNPTIFPKELFNNLKQIFLELFHLDFDELDNETYREEFSALPPIRHLDMPEAKKQMFEDLVAAKKAFKNSIFLLEFKAAMKELRHATFVSFKGVPGGCFTKRQRHLPKNLLNQEKMQVSKNIDNSD